MDRHASSSNQANGFHKEVSSVSTARSENQCDSKMENAESKKETKWGSIWLASIILFLVAVQFSVYFSSLWPYMSQIDPSATQFFYGCTLAAYSGGQMVASPLFGFWNAKIKRARAVMAVGVLFSVAGNLLYIFTEAVPTNRKWMIFFGRFLCGVAGGIAGTVRGYVATASAPKDQHRAVSIGTVFWQLGISGGPAIQAILTPIGYPGAVVGPLHVNEYTAAAYISIAAAIILLVLLCTIFKEHYTGVDNQREKDPFHYVPKPDYKAAVLLMVCWFSAFFMLTNNDTVESPYTMAVFNWTNDQAVLYNSIIIGISTFLGFVLYILYTINAKRINERVSLLCGLCFLFSFYVFTFSWWFYTGHLDFKDSGSVNVDANVDVANVISTSPSAATTPAQHKQPVGCDPGMEWCHYTPRLPLPIYLASYPLLSFGFPMCNISIATLFAKVLGPRRQGFMQSMMVMSGSLARTLGPILISWLFFVYGPRVAWLLTSSIIAVSIFSVVIAYNRLVPLQMRPKLATGQNLRYDGGTLYRF